MSDSPDVDESTDQTTPGDTELSQQELDEIEAERKERLDPDNRPEHAEVDNTDRDFDSTTGQFTDHEPDPDLGPFEDPE